MRALFLTTTKSMAMSFDLCVSLYVSLSARLYQSVKMLIIIEPQGMFLSHILHTNAYQHYQTRLQLMVHHRKYPLLI